MHRQGSQDQSANPRLSQLDGGDAAAQHSGFWACNVPPHNCVEALLPLTHLVEAQYILCLDKLVQDTPALQFLTVDLRAVDLTSVIMQDDRLTLLTDHIFWRFKCLVAIRYATDRPALQSLLKEMTDRAKLQNGRVSVHAMQQVPNQWDIDLATDLAWTLNPGEEAEESVSSFPFQWGQVKWDWWSSVCGFPLSTTVHIDHPLKDVSEPTVHRTTSGYWYRGAAQSYPFVVNDPPAATACNVATENLAVEQQDRMQFPHLGYTVYSGVLDVTDGSLGLPNATDVISNAMADPNGSSVLDILFNTHPVGELMSNPALPRRYVTKANKSGVTKETQKALRSAFEVFEGDFKSLHPGSWYTVASTTGEQRHHRDLRPTPDTLPPPPANPEVLERAHVSTFVALTHYSIAIHRGSLYGECRDAVWDTVSLNPGDVLVMAATCRHHGVDAADGQPFQAALFNLWTPDAARKFAPKNVVFEDELRGDLPDGYPILEHTHIENLSSWVMLGAEVSRARLCVPEEDLMGRFTDEGCEYHPCYLSCSSNRATHFEFTAGDIVVWTGPWSLAIEAKSDDKDRPMLHATGNYIAHGSTATSTWSLLHHHKWQCPKPTRRSNATQLTVTCPCDESCAFPVAVLQAKEAPPPLKRARVQHSGADTDEAMSAADSLSQAASDVSGHGSSTHSAGGAPTSAPVCPCPSEQDADLPAADIVQKIRDNSSLKWVLPVGNNRYPACVQFPWRKTENNKSRQGNLEWTWSQHVRMPPASHTMHMPCRVITRDLKVNDVLAVFMYRTKSGHWMFEWSQCPPDGTATDAMNAKQGTMPLSSVVTWSAQESNFFGMAFLRMRKHIQKVWNKEWRSMIDVDGELDVDALSVATGAGSGRGKKDRKHRRAPQPPPLQPPPIAAAGQPGPQASPLGLDGREALARAIREKEQAEQKAREIEMQLTHSNKALTQALSDAAKQTANAGHLRERLDEVQARHQTLETDHKELRSKYEAKLNTSTPTRPMTRASGATEPAGPAMRANLEPAFHLSNAATAYWAAAHEMSSAVEGVKTICRTVMTMGDFTERQQEAIEKQLDSREYTKGALKFAEAESKFSLEKLAKIAQNPEWREDAGSENA